MSSNESNATREEVIVTVIDPLTWSRDFSYEVESSILAAGGATLVVPADEQERDSLLTRADAVISSGLVKVDAELISKLERCVAIQCYSVGMNAVDIEAASRSGIQVANVNASTADVADHTIALLLALQRRLVPMFEATERGEWDLRKLPVAREIRRLDGQTLGIVGAGRIGKLVATRARAFGFQTVANDPVEPDPPDPELEMVPLPELFQRSDAVALCASLGPTSHRMIDSDVLAHAKPGMLLVNTARGGLIDEKALVEALDDGRIGLAALDVRDPEPPDPLNDLLSGRPDVVQTPHMAAMSEQSRSDIHYLVGESLLRMLAAGGRISSNNGGGDV